MVVGGKIIERDGVLISKSNLYLRTISLIKSFFKISDYYRVKKIRGHATVLQGKYRKSVVVGLSKIKGDVKVGSYVVPNGISYSTVSMIVLLFKSFFKKVLKLI